MLIVAMRTDKPEAELGVYDDAKQLAYESWQAHRELAETIHKTLEGVLERAGKKLHDIEGIVVFKGPGSFTGLRIGLSVANALAYGLGVPIVASEGGDWIEQGIARVQSGENEQVALPEYGAPVHITAPKK